MRAKEASAAGVQVVDHPLVAARLSILRARATPPNEFRDNIQQLAIILLGEAARAWETRVVEMESPLRWFLGAELARPIVLVPILRAGLGLLDGMIRIVPEASTGHIGIYRDPQTLRPVRYYSRLPPNLSQAQVLLLDPMLATGQSAAEAVSILKAEGAERIQFVCLVACPTGIKELRRSHPEVPIIAAAVDLELNSAGYIVPGLGDAGDRYFGTT